MLAKIDHTPSVAETTRMDPAADRGQHDRSDRKERPTPEPKPAAPDDRSGDAVTGIKDEKLGTLLDVFA